MKVNGVKSEKRKVLSGVPQGSVLGPILFVLYINDLPKVVQAILYLFADDTKLLKAVTSRQDSILLQNDMNALEEWSKIWRTHIGACKESKLDGWSNIEKLLPPVSFIIPPTVYYIRKTSPGVCASCLVTKITQTLKVVQRRATRTVDA